MSKFKDFGDAGAGKDRESVSFKLHGEEFHTLNMIPGAVFIRIMGSSKDLTVASAAEATDEFFKGVLTEESYGRFAKLLASKDKVVEYETLSEISVWLMEQLTDRPEEQPENSSAGQ